jgi:hypothetical protein
MCLQRRFFSTTAYICSWVSDAGLRKGRFEAHEQISAQGLSAVKGDDQKIEQQSAGQHLALSTNSSRVCNTEPQW